MAQADEFLEMIWCADALISGRAELIQGRLDFPGDATDYAKDGKFPIPKWELEGLVNEYFTVSGRMVVGHKRLNCRSWGAFSRLVNYQRKMGNAESLMDVDDASDLLDSMPRLFWPQASWQVGYINANRTYRNLYVYGFPEASAYFKRKYGLSVEQFFFLSFAFFASSSSSGPFTDVRTSAEGLGVPVDQLKCYLSVISNSVTGMARRARDLRSGTGISAFKRSPIRERPLIRINDQSIIAPIPDLLLARATEGLYYDLVDDANIRRICGARFEDYCCMVLRHYLPENLRLLRDQDLEVQGAPDIVIAAPEGEASVIIECKARRLPFNVLSSPKPQTEHGDAFEDLVKGVLQIWKFVAVAQTLGVGSCTCRDLGSLGGVVLTLDPWVQLGTTIIKAVISRAKSAADSRGIEERYRIPVSFSAVADFERTLSERGLAATCRAARRLSAPDRYGYLIGTVADRDIASRDDTDKVEPFSYSTKMGELCPWFQGSVNRETYSGLP